VIVDKRKKEDIKTEAGYNGGERNIIRRKI